MTIIISESLVEKITKLKKAVKESNIEDIVTLVKAGAPTDAEIGAVPMLLYAAQREMWDVVEEFFILGADMDIKYNILDWTLIHQLASSGQDEKLENYLPFINNKNQIEKSKGRNALMIAILSDKRSTFDILKEANLEIRCTDKDGNNVLHYLARAEWIDVLKELVEKHYTLFTVPNKKGETVLDIANMKMTDFIENVSENVEDVTSFEDVGNIIGQNQEEVKVTVAKSKLSKIKRIS